MHIVVSFSMAVPRAARRSFRNKGSSERGAPCNACGRGRPPMTAPLFVFAFSVAVPRTARRSFRKKEERARCTLQLMRSRAPALKTASHIVGSPATAVPRFGRRSFLNNSTSERGAPCNSRASPLKAAIGASLRTAVPRAARRSCGGTHADPLLGSFGGAPYGATNRVRSVPN